MTQANRPLHLKVMLPSSPKPLPPSLCLQGQGEMSLPFRHVHPQKIRCRRMTIRQRKSQLKDLSSNYSSRLPKGQIYSWHSPATHNDWSHHFNSERWEACRGHLLCGEAFPQWITPHLGWSLYLCQHRGWKKWHRKLGYCLLRLCHWLLPWRKFAGFKEKCL